MEPSRAAVEAVLCAWRPWVAASVLATSIGCDEPAPAPGAPPASAPPAGIVSQPPARPVSAQPGGTASAPGAESGETVVDEGGEPSGSPDCAEVDPSLPPVQLLKLTFTSAVEDKKPIDKLNVARPGQRVWAHIVARNRTGTRRCVHLAFRVGGKVRTEVELEVGESWSWRTWAYNTLRPSDTSGKLELEVSDEHGKRITLVELPIVPG